MEEPQTSRSGILELVKISLPNSDEKVKFLRNHKIHGTLVYQARYNRPFNLYPDFSRVLSEIFLG